jgi:hypothetical protein
MQQYLLIESLSYRAAKRGNLSNSLQLKGGKKEKKRKRYYLNISPPVYVLLSTRNFESFDPLEKTQYGLYFSPFSLSPSVLFGLKPDRVSNL